MSTQVMKDYVAERSFNLGNPPMSITKGTHIQFNGSSIIIDEHHQSMPTFRGAITAGWVVAAADYDASRPTQAPQPAGIQVRDADGGNPLTPKKSTMSITTQAEETEVMNTQIHAQAVQANNRRGVRMEPQDGVTVRTLSNPARQASADATYAHSVIAEANNVKVEAGVGRSRDDVLATMDPEQRSQYEAEIASRREIHLHGDTSLTVPGPSTQGKVVAKLAVAKTAERQGITTTLSVGGGTDTVDLSGLDGGKAKQGSLESEGIRFGTTNVPSASPPPPSVVDLDPRRVIAKAFCGDFPESYDFDAPPKKKIARLMADFEDRLDIIKAVAASETDQDLKRRLLEEFPEAFKSV